MAAKTCATVGTFRNSRVTRKPDPESLFSKPRGKGDRDPPKSGFPAARPFGECDITYLDFLRPRFLAFLAARARARTFPNTRFSAFDRFTPHILPDVVRLSTVSLIDNARPNDVQGCRAGEKFPLMNKFCICWTNQILSFHHFCSP